MIKVPTNIMAHTRHLWAMPTIILTADMITHVQMNGGRQSPSPSHFDYQHFLTH